MLEGPVDYGENRKLTSLLDDIHQSNLQTFHAHGIVDKPKLKSAGMAGIVENTALKPLEIALGDIRRGALPAREIGVNKTDKSELNALGHSRCTMADEPPVQAADIRVLSVQQTESNTRYCFLLRNELNWRKQRELDRLLLSQYRRANKNESEKRNPEQTTVGFLRQLILPSVGRRPNILSLQPSSSSPW